MHPALHHPGMSAGRWTQATPSIPSSYRSRGGARGRDSAWSEQPSACPFSRLPAALSFFLWGTRKGSTVFLVSRVCSTCTQGGWERSHSAVFWQQTQLPDLLGTERMVDPRNQSQSKIWGMHPPLTHLLQGGCSGWKCANEEVYPGPGGECLLS